MLPSRGTSTGWGNGLTGTHEVQQGEVQSLRASWENQAQAQDMLEATQVENIFSEKDLVLLTILCQM